MLNDTPTEDFDLSYRKIQVGAGWNLIQTADITNAANVVLPANFYAAALPTSSSFPSQTVDFGRFMEPEPEPNLIALAYGTQFSMLTIAAAAILSMF